MIEQDTIRLLRECDAGVQMGTKSIDDVFEYVSSKRFRTLLCDEVGAKMKLVLSQSLYLPCGK